MHTALDLDSKFHNSPGYNFGLLLTICFNIGLSGNLVARKEHIEPTLATMKVKPPALRPSVLASMQIFRQKSSCISHFALLARYN